MADLLTRLFRALAPLWEMSLVAAYATAVVFVLRLVLKKRAPRQAICLLWLVVFARLLVPVALQSPLSLVPNALTDQPAQVQDQPVNPDPGLSGPTVGQLTPTVPSQQEGQSSQGAAPALAAPNGSGLTINPGLSPDTEITVPEVLAPSEALAKHFPYEALLAGVWLAGTVCMGGYGLISYLRLRRRLFDAIRAQDGAWEHPVVASPFILGIFRPRIYLPAGLTGPARDFILCHEQAHLRRRDYIVKPICWAALAVHWFNPAAWLAFLLMSRDIEAACDEAVLRRLGSEVKADYSATLLSLATAGRFPAPCPLAFGEGDAKGRIKNVLNYRRPALWIAVVGVLAVVAAAVCLLTDPVTARTPDGGPDPDPSAGQPEDQGLNSLLDPWALEVLNGERQFLIRQYGEDRALDITRLRTAFFGDDDSPWLTVSIQKLAIVDLDGDGENELALWPTGTWDPDRDVPQTSPLGDYTGYLILHQEGDAVYGYTPGLRSFGGVKADGTFQWDGSAFEWGTGRARFSGSEFEVEQLTWCFDSIDIARFYVDGQPADRDAFEAAISDWNARPEPTWYTFTGGILQRLVADSTATFTAAGPILYNGMMVQLPVPTLDGWMVDALEGRRDVVMRDYYSPDNSRAVNLTRLGEVYDELPYFHIEKLTVLTLDITGDPALVLWMNTGGDPYFGFWILREEDGQIVAYERVWRSFEYPRQDGTFGFSSGAGNWGYGRIQFDDLGTGTVDITWCESDGYGNTSYYVNGFAATEAEFWADVNRHEEQQAASWYVYENGALRPADPASPIDVWADEDACSAPVPDFLDEDQQQLYREMYSLYTHLFGPDTQLAAHWTDGDGYPGSSGAVENGGMTYLHVANTRFGSWDRFSETVLSVFTDSFWNRRNLWAVDSESGLGLDTYINVGGQLYLLPASQGSAEVNPNFPEIFELVERTDSSITFTMTGYYSRRLLDGETSAQRDARLAEGYDYTIQFPMTLVKTDCGWRFEQFYTTRYDADPSRFPSQYTAHATPLDAANGGDQGARLVIDDRGAWLTLDGATTLLSDPVTVSNFKDFYCRDFDADGVAEVVIVYWPDKEGARAAPLLALYHPTPHSLVRYACDLDEMLLDFNRTSQASYDRTSETLTLSCYGQEQTFAYSLNRFEGRPDLPGAVSGGYAYYLSDLHCGSTKQGGSAFTFTFPIFAADSAMAALDHVTTDPSEHYLYTESAAEVYGEITFDGMALAVTSRFLQARTGSPWGTLVVETDAQEPATASLWRNGEGLLVLDWDNGVWASGLDEYYDPAIDYAHLYCRDYDGDGEKEVALLQYRARGENQLNDMELVLYDLGPQGLVRHAFSANDLLLGFNRNNVAGYNPGSGHLTVTYAHTMGDPDSDSYSRQYISGHSVLPQGFFDGHETIRDGYLHGYANGFHLFYPDGTRFYFDFDILLADETMQGYDYVYTGETTHCMDQPVGVMAFALRYNADGFVVEPPAMVLDGAPYAVEPVGDPGAARALSDADAAELTALMETGSWSWGATDCAADCVIDLNGRSLTYHSECGAFNEVNAPWSLTLSEEARVQFNAILAQYITLGGPSVSPV